MYLTISPLISTEYRVLRTIYAGKECCCLDDVTGPSFPSQESALEQDIS